MAPIEIWWPYPVRGLLLCFASQVVRCNKLERKKRKYIDNVFKYNNETIYCEPGKQETGIPTTTEISQGEMFPQQPKVHQRTVTELPDESKQHLSTQKKYESTNECSQFSQLAYYILKKDLMLSMITSFNDKCSKFILSIN